jgi:putative hydrolase of the HAD superfamily
MEPDRDPRAIDTVLFDFGGVLAEEGFRDGLAAIGRLSGLDEEDVVRRGHELVLTTGYVTGRAGEQRWWEALRAEAGVRGAAESLRGEILGRFVLRPRMLDIVGRLRGLGFTVGILSDQTNWLDELDGLHGLYGRFDYVFNSYHMGKSKNDASHFGDVLKLLHRQGRHVLFLDDNAGHVDRARNRGWAAFRFRDEGDAVRALSDLCEGP